MNISDAGLAPIFVNLSVFFFFLFLNPETF